MKSRLLFYKTNWNFYLYTSLMPAHTRWGFCKLSWSNFHTGMFPEETSVGLRRPWGMSQSSRLGEIYTSYWIVLRMGKGVYDDLPNGTAGEDTAGWVRQHALWHICPVNEWFVQINIIICTNLIEANYFLFSPAGKEEEEWWECQ